MHYNPEYMSLGWYFQIGTTPNLLVDFLDVMPKKTYGPQIQKRVKRLLEALLCYVDGEFDDYGFDIKHNNWIEEDGQNPKLIVQTTLVTLEWLTEKDKYPGKLTKSQIREALKLLDKDNKDSRLKILVDNRATKRGSENWHFTLKLWSKDKEQNLRRFDEEWERKKPHKSKQEAVATTKATSPYIKRSYFCEAPALPQNFVKRPTHQKAVKKLLLSQEANRPGTLVVSAIYGLGGIGKSILAAALAHDEDVQACFTDGVLWATLGKQPDLLSLLSRWIQALGDNNYKPIKASDAKTYLQTLLYEKKVLLVVDDAWNPEHVEYFQVGGVGCRVLVTTREVKILGATRYDLEVMTKSESLQILESQQQTRKFTQTEKQQAEFLAETVGYLPLALELAAAQIADGITWEELLEDLRAEIARLDTLDLCVDVSSEEKRKKYSLVASFNLSLQSLTPELLQQFAWFGVLPEDVVITHAMAATLWGVNARQALTILRQLRSKELLQTGTIQFENKPTYKLHDLIHDVAVGLLTGEKVTDQKEKLPGLGFSLLAAHSALLDRYQEKTQSRKWHTLPGDGYIHAHLTWHFQQANQLHQIHQLLAEKSATGGNGWYEMCDKLGQTANFVTDVARAWELVEDSWTETTSSQVIGLQCRYALIIASLNSLAANVPVELLITSIQKNVWTPEQGLAYVLQSSNPAKKVNLLTELINHLPPNLKELALSKALAAAREIQDDWRRAEALSNLAKEMSELLPEALAAAREIQDDWRRAEALSILAEVLPKLLPEALAAAREIQDDWRRAEALSNLAKKLSELLPEALIAAREIQDDWRRAKALSSLAKELPELLPEALTAAREIQDESSRAEALSSLAKELPPELLPEALTASREIQDERYRIIALRSLSKELPPELLPEALAAAREIQEEIHRAYTLSSLANELPPDLLPEVLAAAREIQDEDSRAYTLSSLAKELPELLPEALAAAREIQYDWGRAYTLSSLAPILPPELLPEALAAAREIQDENSRAKSLRSLAEVLPELLPETLAAAREIQDEGHRSIALRSLSKELPPELLPEALAAAREIQDDWTRAYTLSSLAKELPPELLLKALAAAKEIQDDWRRAEALRSLAKKLPELLPEALAAAREIKLDWRRAEALSSLTKELPPELLLKALAAAKEIQDDWRRAEALRSLAKKLPELLPEALAAAREIQNEDSRAYTLSSLAKELPELLPEALAAAREIQNEESRAYTLSSLAKELPELLPEALAAAREIQDEDSRAEALSSLANELPELLPEALAAAMEIQNEYSRGEALSSLAPILPPELLPEALAAAREIQNEESRAYTLSSLANELPPELLPEVLAAAREIQDEDSRAYTLSSLAKELPELLPEALAAAREIQYDWGRAYTLSSLAPILPPELLPEALAAAREIQDENSRAKSLRSLAEVLPELLPETLAAAREIQDENSRAEALSGLAKELSQIQKTTLISHWQKTLHVLSAHTRPNLLSDIKALTPVIFSLGGQQAMKDTANAIQDVSRWWR